MISFIALFTLSAIQRKLVKSDGQGCPSHKYVWHETEIRYIQNFSIKEKSPLSGENREIKKAILLKRCCDKFARCFNSYLIPFLYKDAPNLANVGWLCCYSPSLLGCGCHPRSPKRNGMRYISKPHPQPLSKLAERADKAQLYLR